MWYHISLRFVCKPPLIPVANWAKLVLATQNHEVFSSDYQVSDLGKAQGLIETKEHTWERSAGEHRELITLRK